MAKNETGSALASAAEEVDEHGASILIAMGVPEPFPPEIVERYFSIKRVKDKVQPGRLSVETIALIVAETPCSVTPSSSDA